MEWFIHNHDSIIKQWTLKALTVKPKASHTQHAPTPPQHSQRHWTTPRAVRLLKVLFSYFFFNSSALLRFSLFCFFIHLNIFDIKTSPHMMNQPCLWTASPPCPPFIVRPLRSSCWIRWRPIQSWPTPKSSLFLDTWKKNDRVVAEVGETAL